MPLSTKSLSTGGVEFEHSSAEVAVTEVAETKVDERVSRRERNHREQEWLIAEFRPEQLRWQNFWWIGVVAVPLIHVGALVAPFYFNWTAFFTCLGLYWYTGCVGICLGYHRFLAHRSLALAWPAKLFVLFGGVMAAQGTPLLWAAHHRIHHSKSDRPGDPHSPRDGHWWSHLFWIFLRRTRQDKALLEVIYRRYVPDLLQDPIVRFFDRGYDGLFVLSAVALWWLGGWPMILWAFCVRIVIVWHITWCVNSATHLWGYRTYATKDDSRNLWWVGLLAWGEGWHNNHHAYPRAARAGHQWWEIDITWWFIRVLETCGLASHIARDRPAQRVTAIEPA